MPYRLLSGYKAILHPDKFLTLAYKQISKYYPEKEIRCRWDVSDLNIKIKVTYPDNSDVGIRKMGNYKTRMMNDVRREERGVKREDF